MKLYSVILIVVAIVVLRPSDAQENDSSSKKLAKAVPFATATMNSSWSWANPIFQHYLGVGSYYYDVFRVVTSTTGDYIFSSKSSVGTYGYLYLPSFNPTSPGQNIIEYGYPGTNQQFQITHHLDSGVTYYLVVTTSEYLQIGQYQLMVTGAARVALTKTTVLEPSMPSTTIVSAFTHLQPALEDSCSTSSYYSYDIFSIVPQASGDYIIETVFEQGINVRLYNPTFNPLASILNIVAIDSTNEYRSRKQVKVSLVASNRYYLVLSNYYYYYLTQKYRLTFRGPSKFNMTKLTDSLVSRVKTSSSFTKNSRNYSRGYGDTYAFYYKVFRITVPQVGVYSLLGYGRIDILGYLYIDNFSPELYYQNQINNNYYSDSQAKFIIKTKLMNGTNYYLVVTTSSEGVEGAFNLTAAGLQTTSVSAVADSSASSITISSSLTSTSPQFRRCQGYQNTFRYQLFKITVPSLGLYTMKSQGSLDTYGCLYTNRFDPTAAETNVTAYDDQNGGNNQFSVTAVLSSNTVYYLAATTNVEGRTGSFKVTVSGPAKATIVLVKDD